MSALSEGVQWWSLHPWRCLESLDVPLGAVLMLGLGWISEVFSNLTDSVALWWLCCVAGVPACRISEVGLHPPRCELLHLGFVSTSMDLFGPSRSEENLQPRALSSFVRALTS